MPAHSRRSRRRAFTLVELLVVIAVLGILAIILIPVVARIRAAARSTQCVSNLQQLGHAFALYAQENRSCLPPPIDVAAGNRPWYVAIHGYTGTPWRNDIAQLAPVFLCPTWSGSDANVPAIDNIGYSMSALVGPSYAPSRPASLAGLPQPTRTIVLLEQSGAGSFLFPQSAMTLEAFGSHYTAAFGSDGCDRHAGSANYLFADGHVGHHTPQEAAMLLK